MREQVTCAHCRARLLLPVDLGERRMTCPRCLAEVMPPTAPALTEASMGALRETPEAAPPSPAPAALTPDWLEDWRKSREADSDVRRDTQATGCGLGFLATLAVMGALGLGLVSGDLVGPQVVPLLLMALVGVVITALVLVRTRSDPFTSGLGWFVLWGFGLVGGFVLMILALGVLVLLVCLVSR